MAKRLVDALLEIKRANAETLKSKAEVQKLRTRLIATTVNGVGMTVFLYFLIIADFPASTEARLIFFALGWIAANLKK